MKRSHSSTRLSLPPHRQKGLIFLAIFLVLSLVSVFFLWQKIFYREEIAGILPADSTLAFAEFDVDPNSPQVQQFNQIFQSNPFLSTAGINQYSHNLVPDLDQIQTWFGGRFGVALLSLNDHGNPAMVILAKVKDRQKATEYINNSQQSQNFRLLDSPGYLLMSDRPEVFNLISQTLQNQSQTLQKHPRYNQIYSALPQQNLAFIYFDSSKIFASLAENPNFLDKKLSLFQKYLPFLSLFSADGISLYAEQQTGKPALVAQQLSLFDQSKLPSPEFFRTSYRLNGNLLDLLPDQSDFKLASSHLQDQKNKLQQIFSDRSTVQELLFSGSLEQLKQTYLGTSLDLDKDFFPLFENEFALSVDSLSAPAFSLAMQMQNPADQQKVQNLLLTIAKQVDLESSAKKETFTLPDDSKGEAIVAHPVEPSFEQQQLEGHTVQKINFNGQLDLYFTFIDNQLLASTSSENLQSMITKFITPSAGTAKPKSFFQQLDGITEYYTFNLTKILGDLDQASLRIFIKPFSDLSIGRKFTEIGLLSIYRLE
jgi:hypothetical protein